MYVMCLSLYSGTGGWDVILSAIREVVGGIMGGKMRGENVGEEKKMSTREARG